MPELRGVRGWLRLAALWCIPGVLDASSSVVLSIVKGFEQTARSVVLADALPWQLWTPASALLVALWRRVPLRTTGLARALAIHGAANLAIAVADALVRFALYAAAEVEWPEHLDGTGIFVVLLARGALLNLALYWGIVAVLAGLDARRRAREAALEQARLAARLVEAHLDALKSQLQPHFLFNTLNAIAVLVRKGDGTRALAMLDGLATLLRRSLASLRVEFGSLADELDFVRTYLDIERVRFAERLRVVLDVDDVAAGGRVPNLLLQPLVENAIRHGLAPRARGGTLTIRARVADATLVVTIHDDGVGVHEPVRDGVGLGHVRARLEQLFPGRHRFELARVDGGGTVATVAIPYSREVACAS